MGQATSSYPTVDLSGKVILVTGGNIGLGYATAKALAVMGAHTIIACRSKEKAEAAVGQMKEELGKQYPDKSINLEWMLLDLGSFRSTKDFTVAFKERNLPLHVLINNAGVAASPFALTEDGHETQFQVNHLSHLLLTLELLPILMDTASSTGDGRIVIVSSSAHQSGVFDPNNLDGQQLFNRFKFYANSKLFNVMSAYALQRRLQNVGITVSAIHPGFVKTTLGHQPDDSNTKKNLMSVIWFVTSPVTKNVENGAATQINCAVNPELNKQKMFYYADSAPKEPIAAARDEAQQEQLWEISINMIKEFLTPELMQRYGPTLPVKQQGEEQTTAGKDRVAEQGEEQATAGKDGTAEQGEEQTTAGKDGTAEQGEEQATAGKDGVAEQGEEQTTAATAGKDEAAEQGEEQTTAGKDEAAEQGEEQATAGKDGVAEQGEDSEEQAAPEEEQTAPAAELLQSEEQ